MNFEIIKANLSLKHPIPLGIPKEGNNILNSSIIEFLRNMWKVPMVIDAAKIEKNFSYLKYANEWGHNFQAIIIHNIYEIDSAGSQILKILLDKKISSSIFIVYEENNYQNNSDLIKSILDRVKII